MKIGTIVVNPYAKYVYFGTNNPMKRLIYLGKYGRFAKCLRYDGSITEYYYDDILRWETDGYVDVKKEVLKWFGMEGTE